MIKQIIIIGILISVLLTSGCVQHTGEGTAESQMSVEDQADSAIEQELDQATENITIGDIENSLGE